LKLVVGLMDWLDLGPGQLDRLVVGIDTDRRRFTCVPKK